MTGPQPMLDSFCTYLRRQLGPDGPSVVKVDLGESIRRAPSRAGIVVAAGERSAWGERLFAMKSGMHAQWRGAAKQLTMVPSDPGVPFTVWDRWDRAKAGMPPPGFDVLAIVTTYNEAGIVAQTLERLLSGGVRVHVIDNWSTDDTASIVERYVAPGKVSLERFPVDGPTRYFELQSLLAKVSAVAHDSGADWVVHHDCDEIHDSAWRGVSLRQGLFCVERFGFNVVDHTAVEFRPVEDTWKPGDDLDTSFEWFEFGSAPAHFTLLKAWKPQAQMVTNAETGGHSIEFAGRRVFPYKFPIRHYPLRSSAHARHKLFTERRPRWNPEERAKGWHQHYEEFDEGSTFLWDPSTLYRWDRVDEDLLLQRLSGVWLPNNPFDGEGAPSA